MFVDYISLAFKNVRKRGIRSWLTMLGIFIGIAAVVALISLGQGLQNAITGQFSQLDPDKLVLQSAETGFGPPGSTAVRKLTEDDLEIVEDIEGVDIVVPRYVRSVAVEFNERSRFRFATNLPPDSEKAELVYDVINTDLESGQRLDENDRKKVVLGHDFTGDEFGRPIEIGKDILIQGEEFEVIGIFEESGSFIINGALLLPEEDLEEILDIEDEYDIIAIQVEDRDEIETVRENLVEALREDRNQDPGEEDFTVQTPEQSLQTINTILASINLVVGGIAAISLLVGGIGITNTMYTSVLERTREIGIMKAVGARNGDILRIFLIESALLGLAGGIVGAIIGLGMAFGVSYAVGAVFPGIDFSVSISAPLLTMAISFSLIIGTIAGILPARQASRMQPVEALRK